MDRVSKSDFYLTLPSDAHYDNKTGDYTVRLPYQINLPGEWQCALTDILYPFSWTSISNTRDRNDYTAAENCLYIIANNGKMYKVFVQPDHYDDVEVLCDEIMKSIFETIMVSEEEDNQYRNMKKGNAIVAVGQLCYFSFESDIRRASVVLKTDIIREIILSKRLQYMLGMETAFLKNKENIAKYPPALSGTEALWVYCDIIENQVIGNTTGQLLKIVHVEGEFGKYIEKSFTNPHYLPILSKKIDQIKISIRERSGKVTPFQFGSVVIKLHIKRKRFLI